jgi:ferredoxin-type protein NapH
MLVPLAGLGFFRGNLASAELLGLVLADPLALLQVVLATGIVVPAFVGAALMVVLFYWLLGGRTFCSWTCPVYLLTELADRLRQWLASGGRTFPLAAKYGALAVTALLTAATGLPLFETVSPIGMVTRALAFGGWAALSFLAGILVVEVVVSRRLWCRSLCPLGGFYSLVGKVSPVKVRFVAASCTRCGDCFPVCPVEEVLEPSIRRDDPLVRSGECTRCGRCIDVCPVSALKMGIGYHA